MPGEGGRGKGVVTQKKGEGKTGPKTVAGRTTKELRKKLSRQTPEERARKR